MDERRATARTGSFDGCVDRCYDWSRRPYSPGGFTIRPLQHLRVAAGLGLIVSLSTACAEEPAPPQLGPRDGAELPPGEPERVAVGDTAPDFSLRSHGGDVVTLSEYQGKRAVLLVFYRGHW